MKKVGIVTIIDNQNYGNRLQNFALSYFIQKNVNINVITVRNKGFEDYTYTKEWTKERRENWLRQTRAGNWLISIIRKRRDKKKSFYCLIKERERKFEKFNQRHIKFTSYELCSYRWKHKDLRNFCLFITGSDQVWNPKFQRATRVDFLQFTSPEKRISYAASIGLSYVPESKIIQFNKYLSGMKHISVREQTAKILVENYSNKSAMVVCDPTLLLTQEEWISVEKKPDIELPQHYLVVYFLGEIAAFQKKIIEVYAKKACLEILYMNNLEVKSLYTLGPDEFVYMFHHADAIFTDSYHGCIFSILFHKNFWVFKRDNYDIYSRIQDMLDCFELKDRVISEKKENLKIIGEEQYTKVIDRLLTERKRSKDWLLSILIKYV